MQELRDEDVDCYKNFVRILPNDFSLLVED